jgi:hypothetical protein
MARKKHWSFIVNQVQVGKKSQQWNSDEDTKLKYNAHLGIELLKKLLYPRTEVSIKARVYYLGYSMKKPNY